MSKKYHFTSEQLSKLLFATVDMMIEYRDVHGQNEDAARFSAVNEMFEGLDAELELFNNGEVRGLSLQSDGAK